MAALKKLLARRSCCVVCEGRTYVSFSKVTLADCSASAESEEGVTESDVIFPLKNALATKLRHSL